MKYLFLVVIVFFFAFRASAQNMDVKQINQKMTEIRQNTNWDDPVASKKANEEIKKLAKQLMLAKQKVNINQPNKVDEIKQENVEANTKIWNQMMKSFEQGKDADILLGTPVREEIVEDYKEDESPKNITPEFLQEMTVLVIDMSLPTVQRTIDLMQNYKSIKTLIITSGKHEVAVNLQDLMNKASNYPLENLYIINFGHFVSKIPEQINHFRHLSTLAIFNNKISQLPNNISSLSKLDSLFIDINPISTLFPAINSMKNLKTLSIAKTSVSDAEIKKIQKILPECEVKIK